MTFQSNALTVADEIRQVLSGIDENAVNALVDLIEQANTVFVCGAGRSGFMARAFTMRLMHMGKPAYVVGETVTPGIQKGDLLIVCSGSGETESLSVNAMKAKRIGASIAIVTINPNSTIALLSDAVVEVNAPSPKSAKESDIHSIEPEGTLFEQCLLITLDLIVLELMKKSGETSESMFHRHANLE